MDMLYLQCDLRPSRSSLQPGIITSAKDLLQAKEGARVIDKSYRLDFLNPGGAPAYAADVVPALSARRRETSMAWTTPTLVEICVGLEINGYLPAEF
jgi:coenzyme PQQ precursor peptide PqqA